MIFKKWAALIIFVAFTACSHKPTTPNQVGVTGEEIDQFLKLSPEEQQRMKALEYYRQQRLKDWDDSIQAPALKRTVSPVSRPPQKIAKPQIQPQPKKAEPEVDKEAQNIEIEQRLSFFCMQNRQNSRFNEEGSCESYTKEVLDNCLNQHSEGKNSLTLCIKQKLR